MTGRHEVAVQHSGPSPDTNPYIYSYGWAQQIVQEFTEKYARATKFVATMCGISHKEVCLRLIDTVRRKNQLKWEATKKAWKEMEREEIGDFWHLTGAQRRNYLLHVKYSAVDFALYQSDTPGFTA